MTIIQRVAAGAFLLTIITVSGCGSGTTASSSDSSAGTGMAAGMESALATESIAGLPQQKDSVKPSKQYTDYKFATAQDAIEFMQKSPEWPRYQEGILPQMAGEELGYAAKLLNSPYNHFIVVDKDKMKVLLFDRYGRIVRQYPMAGPRNYGTKHKKGDSRTPEGYFSAEGIYDSTDWEFTDDNGVKHPGKCFGPRFIRVKNPVTTQIGIHGTSAPGSIGKRTSHGCIRVTDQNILELVKYVEIGMPVIILPGPKDREVNAGEGYHTGYFNSGVEPFVKVKSAVKPSMESVVTDSIANSGNNQEDATPAVRQPQEEPETPEQTPVQGE